MSRFLDRFARTSREPKPDGATTGDGPTVVQIDATSLSHVFSAPTWVRDLGLLAWFLVGVAILLVGLTWLLAVTSTITIPVAIGAILATVAGPLVTKMQRRGLPRAAGAAIVLLGLLLLGVVVTLMVFGGIYEQSDEIKASAQEAVDKIEGWVNDAGAGGTSSTADDIQSSTTETGKTLLQGIAAGIQGLTSFVFFLTFSIFSTFFLLKDGPTVRRFINRNMGVPLAVAETITANVIQSLRRYFLGVSIVAAFNAVVVDSRQCCSTYRSLGPSPW